ncbi:Myb-like DNA-binding domain containing protein [Tritrichomonas foetus]|uniref:Myb-like DNA-binding domain containing protein n=1 Tax=Tritrichomonas foetus TaxID=1144522 RepID=A0A1J4J486_9EUKA|nr:Myb-like DNA-binding domain containing protein [Tritrichomonas foetus]|eukprot:OHS94208.1 Myb-like DNA-binding domain containing protein [Tritrichomonas foetus]
MNTPVSKHRPSYFTPKIKFTPHEDQLLLQAVSQFGSSDWHVVAAKVPGRNARQCRERWNNYVNPAIVASPWTKEEDQLLLAKYEELGPRWHTIASFFSTRSTNNIKNRFFTLQRHNRRKNRKMLQNSNHIQNIGQNVIETVRNTYNQQQKKSFVNNHEFNGQLDNIDLTNQNLTNNELNDTGKVKEMHLLEIQTDDQNFLNWNNMNIQIDDSSSDYTTESSPSSSPSERKLTPGEPDVTPKGDERDPLAFMDFLKDSDSIFWSNFYEELSRSWLDVSF